MLLVSVAAGWDKPGNVGTLDTTPDSIDAILAAREVSAGVGQDEIVKLNPEEAVQRKITWNETHAYRLTLASGQFGHVVVEQRGIDLVVKLFAPDGRQLLEADNPTGEYGAESVAVLAETAGDYKIEVRPSDSGVAAGDYNLKIETLRAPTESDRNRLAAIAASVAGKQLLQQGTIAASQAALDKYQEALQLWRRLGDQSGEAITLQNIANVYKSSRKLSTVVDYYTQAIRLRQQTNNRPAEAHTLYELGAAYRYLDELPKALECYEAALLIFQETGRRRSQAQLLTQIGLVQAELGQLQKAKEYSLEKALPLWQEIKDLRGEAGTLNNLGGIHDELGEPHEAIKFYERAAQIWGELQVKSREAITHNNLGKIYDDLGEQQKALESYEKALTLYQSSPRYQRENAIAHDNIGMVYVALNDFPRAMEHFDRSLAIWDEFTKRQGTPPPDLASTLTYIGYAHILRGDAREALSFNERALALLPEDKKPRERSALLNSLGMTYTALNQLPQALSMYTQALRIRRQLGNPRRLALTLDKMGDVYAGLGETQKALDCYNEALRGWRSVEDHPGEAMTLYGLARLEHNRNNLVAGNKHIEEAVRLIEAQRTKVYSQQLRVSYLASKINYYELDIELKMQLHLRDPLAGYDAAALHSSEKARARGLIDTLTASRAVLREGVSPALVERHRVLSQQLNVKAEMKMRLLARKHTPEEAAAFSNEIAALTTRYDELDASLRSRSPHYGVLSQPLPLGEIQKLLDDDTLLLEYVLGEKNSYVWAVSRTSLKSETLPARRDIETLCNDFKESLLARVRVKGETQESYLERVAAADKRQHQLATQLSVMLLGKVVSPSAKKRLLIVADGIIQHIPFNALAARQRPAAPEFAKISASAPDAPPALLDEHEIVYLPSASTLAALRRESARRSPALKAVAVIADPVYERDDSRLLPLQAAKRTPAAQTEWEKDLSRAVNDSTAPNAREAVRHLPRLLNSGLEAAEILALTPSGASLKAVNFMANRETATSPELRQYRIIHFATHGLLDDDNPELSGIVLSLLDEQGRPQNGYLRLHDIYNLDLPAELIVLSACRTALGKEVKGEGIMGLTRGFMYAGATRVVASLWKVDDMATAELMKHFYRGMFREGMSPAASLRAAQVALREKKRWRAPYYWAGFVLYGESK